MTAQDLFEFFPARPFKLFGIYGTDGKTRDVRPPDEALVLRTRVIPPPGGRGETPELSEHEASAHTVRLGEMATAADAGA